MAILGAISRVSQYRAAMPEDPWMMDESHGCLAEPRWHNAGDVRTGT